MSLFNFADGEVEVVSAVAVDELCLAEVAPDHLASFIAAVRVEVQHAVFVGHFERLVAGREVDP